MADVRPTLTEIFDRMKTDSISSQPGVDVNLPRSLFGVLLTSFVGAIHESWGHLQSIADDGFIDTASEKALERRALEWGVVRIQSTKATGVANLGPHDTPPSVAISRLLVRADGVLYRSTSVPVENPSLDWEIDIEALVAGTDGNYVGDLQLIEPTPGITTIPAVTTSGADGDTIEELRTKFLSRLRNPPQGGNAVDFETWVLAIPSLSRVWSQDPVAGSPDFTIYCADDTQDPPTPSAPDVVLAQTSVDALGPVTANPTVSAATFQALDAAITILPNTSEVQDAVDDELVSMLLERAAPGTTILLSWIQEAVGRTPGLVDFTITSPVADVPATGDNVIYLGTTVFS